MADFERTPIGERVITVKEDKPLIGYSGVSNTTAGFFDKLGAASGVSGLYDTTEEDFARTLTISNAKYGPKGAGVYGFNSTSGAGGVQGDSTNKKSHGVIGTNYGGGIGVAGISEAANGVGLYGKGSALAGKFDGNVEVNGNINAGGDIAAGNITVTGDIQLIHADCAENFDIVQSDSTPIDSGTVMVIESEETLRVCSKAYDKRVAGVVSGAGKYKPAMILDSRETDRNRLPVALIGKVLCKVDASFGEIKVGDLLTTSPTPGHAMKVEDNSKGFGTVLGKALADFDDGKGLIPILVALQ
jgi:hypothetical protein